MENNAKSSSRLLGLGLFVFGTALSGWIAYNQFVQETEAFRAATDGGKFGMIGLFVGVVCAVVGLGFFTRAEGEKTSSANGAAKLLDAMEGLEPSVLDNMTALALSGRKIDAIKFCREQTNLGLKDAKEAVEELVRRAA